MGFWFGILGIRPAPLGVSVAHVRTFMFLMPGLDVLHTAADPGEGESEHGYRLRDQANLMINSTLASIEPPSAFWAAISVRSRYISRLAVSKTGPFVDALLYDVIQSR